MRGDITVVVGVMQSEKNLPSLKINPNKNIRRWLLPTQKKPVTFIIARLNVERERFSEISESSVILKMPAFTSSIRQCIYVTRLLLFFCNKFKLQFIAYSGIQTDYAIHLFIIILNFSLFF